MSLKDFASQKEAFVVADAMYEENKKEHGHNYEVEEHSNPLLTKFFFVECHGKKRTWSHLERATLGLETDVKSKKQLLEDENFGTVFGNLENEASGSTDANPAVKQENPVKPTLAKKVETLRLIS